MSLAWSNRVWLHSRASGSRLLLLLAIADNADDETGIAWPSIGYLVQKTRMLERRVQRGLRWLEATGELKIEARLASSNQYRLTGTGDVKTGGGVKKGGGPSDTQNQEEQLASLHVAEHCVTSQDQPPEPTALLEQAAIETSRKQTKAQLLVAFENFWKIYPPRKGRRDKKSEAVLAYLKLTPDPALQQQMCEAVEVYAMGTELPVDACRWIKGRRWEDETLMRVVRRARPVVLNPELVRIAALNRELGRR